MAPDDLDTTVDRLYAGAPEHFVEQRDAAAKAARADGDRELASRIKELRRPTTAAALINRLRRSPDHTGLDELLDLGERLREAQSSLDAPAMKSLSAERNSLIRKLLGEAGELSDEPLSGTVREQLSDTFTAAVADADAGHAVGSGRLVSGLRYSGFGEVDLSDAVAVPLPSRADERAADGTDADATTTTTTAPADESDAADEREADERKAEKERAATERRLADARSALSAARDKERAARDSADLAERALEAARRTAKSARTRAEAAAAARVAAEEAVRDAEAAATTRS